jgi:hypothetical protein
MRIPTFPCDRFFAAVSVNRKSKHKCTDELDEKGTLGTAPERNHFRIEPLVHWHFALICLRLGPGYSFAQFGRWRVQILTACAPWSFVKEHDF